MIRQPTFRSEEEYEEYRDNQRRERENERFVRVKCDATGHEFNAAPDDPVVSLPPEKAMCPAHDAFQRAIDDPEIGLAFDTAFNREYLAGRIGNEFSVADVDRIRAIAERSMMRKPVGRQVQEQVAELSR